MPSPSLTCRELISFLDEYVDGGLSAAQRARFGLHFAACAHCRDFLRTYRDTIALARAEADSSIPPEVPREIIDGVLAATRRSPT